MEVLVIAGKDWWNAAIPINFRFATMMGLPTKARRVMPSANLPYSLMSAIWAGLGGGIRVVEVDAKPLDAALVYVRRAANLSQC
jgi:hypothetical protein